MPLQPVDIVELRKLALAVVATHGWDAAITAGQQRACTTLRPPVVRITKGKATVVIEIPPPSTTKAEVLTRQRQYERAGIRCLWLLSSPDFPVSKGLPAAFVDRQGADGVVARLPGQNLPSDKRNAGRASDWQQSLPVDQLLEAAFTGEFWYGNLRQGRQARVRLDGEFTKCEGCGEWTNLLRAIEILSDYSASHFVLYRLDEVPPHLLAELVPNSIEPSKVGPLRPKYIRPEKRTRIVNSCVRCRQIQLGSGSSTSTYSPITQFDIEVSKRLADATAQLPSARWRISI